MKDKTKHIVFGGSGKGKMMQLEEFIKQFPEDMQKDIIVVRPSDPVPELRGNKLPRVVDYDMVELSQFSFETWEAITGIKTKRTIQ